MNKSAVVLIPDECKAIYVFDTEEMFLDAVNSGQMTPIYGTQAHEKEYLPVFIAVMNHNKSEMDGQSG